MNRSRFLAFGVALALFGALAPSARAAEPTAEAEKAARAWLALTDGGKYGASWDGAAAAFKAAVTKDKWEEAMQRVRAPLGALKSRTLKGAQLAKDLPGAPAGEYVVIQFDAEFENRAGSVETVTPMKEKDGSWRVSGYYIK